MDTDLKIIRSLKAWTKRRLQLSQTRLYQTQMTHSQAAQHLRDLILRGQPFCAGRLGSNESKVCYRYLKAGHYSKEERFRITKHAGVFPETLDVIDRFAETYSAAFTELDILGVWYPQGEGFMIKEQGRHDLVLGPLQFLEPYYEMQSPWSSALQGLRVLVIHPFKDSILQQYAKRKLIFNNDLLPEFASLEVLRAVQSIAGERSELPDWHSALDYMTGQMDRLNYDLCIVGAGAYGLPLAAHAKRQGKMAIHMGGATQLLFGIRGKRWERHPVISQLFNDAWVRPSTSETPEHKDVVEGGSYW
jgi:hypothetical protein